MKSKRLRLAIGIVLLAQLAIPFWLVAQTTAPVTNGQIAFAQQIGSGGQGANVFVANPDGSNVQQVPLVNMAEDFGVPVWSPTEQSY